MAQSLACQSLALANRRTFWTTQMDACEPTPGCDTECATAGLKLLDGASPGSFTFATNDYVRSLALNMLLTDGRKPDTRCGIAPGAINGHWSESFSAGGQRVGSQVRYITNQASVRDSMNLIKAEVLTTLQKLVDYGIALEVNAEATYRGGGVFDLAIEILGNAVDPTRIGLTAQRNNNSWAWVT